MLLKNPKALWKNVSSSPLSLTLIALLFGSVPILSFLGTKQPMALVQHTDGWRGAALVFNFWIGPFAVALCMITRNKFLLSAFLAQCGTVLLTCMLQLAVPTPEVMELQGVLIGAILSFGYFLVHQDALYPLMHGVSRPWRSARRYHTGASISLSLPDQKTTAKAVLQNCSLTGMEVSATSQSLKPFVEGKKKHDQIDFTLKFRKRIWNLSADMAWSHEEDGALRLGLQVRDKATMAELFAALPVEKRTSPLLQWLSFYWGKRLVRQVSFSLCAILFLAAFTAPVVKRHVTFTGERASSALDSGYVKAGLGTVYSK